MYGNFAINKLSASYGSKVIYEEAGGNDVSNLHIKATSGTAIFADTGTFISIGGDVLLDNSGVEIVLHAKRGSVILAEGIDSAGSHWYDNVTVDTLYKADSGIVLTGGINRVQYTTAKSISSGGVAGVIGGLAYKADAPSNGNLYMRKDGDWVRYDEPTSNVLGYTSFVRRIHVFDDPDNAGVILRTWDWVELEDAPSDDHIYGRKNGAWVRIS